MLPIDDSLDLFHGFKRIRLSHPLPHVSHLPHSPPSSSPSHPSPLSLDFAVSAGESALTELHLASVESSRAMTLPPMGCLPSLDFNPVISHQPPSTISSPCHRSHSCKEDRSDEDSRRSPFFFQIRTEIADSESETRDRFRSNSGFMKIADVPRKAYAALESGATHRLPYLYQLVCGENVQMIDEGSTSNGNYIQPLLSEHQLCNSQFEHLLPDAFPPPQVASASETTSLSLSLETSSSNVSTICGPPEGHVKACGFAGCGKRSRGAFVSSISPDGGRRLPESVSAIRCNPNGEKCFTLECSHRAGSCSRLCSSRQCQFADCRKDTLEAPRFYEVSRSGENHVMEECRMDSNGSVSACKIHGHIDKCASEGAFMCSQKGHYTAAPDDGQCSMERCVENLRNNTLCGDGNGNGSVCCLQSEYVTGEGRKCSWGEDKSMHTGSSTNDKLWTYFKGSCDRYVKDELGFCAEHSALVEDRRVHGSVTFMDSLSGQFEFDPVNGETSESINKEDDAIDVDGYSCESGSPLVGREEGLMREEPKVAFFPSIFAGVPCQSLTLDDASTDLQKQIPRTGSMLESCVSMPNVFGYSSVGKILSDKLPGIGKNSKYDLEDDSIFNMSSLDLPEERVHGGNLMTLIGKFSDNT